MSAAANIPWSSILSEASASLGEMTSLSSADILQLYPPQADVHPEFHSFDLRGTSLASSQGFSRLEQDPLSPRSDAQEKRLPNVADWKGTLDLIADMPNVAEEQRGHLEEQSEAHQRALEDLRQEVNETQRRLHASEARANALQAQADMRLQAFQADVDAQLQDARAESEARVRAICIQSSSLIRATEERVRTADLRARTAEEWLQRIDVVAKNLLLNGHMNRDGGSRRDVGARQDTGT